MSNIEHLGLLCRVLEEQCDRVVARFVTAEANILALRVENARLVIVLLETERERNAALTEVAALKVELAAREAAEEATRNLLHAQEVALA